MTIRTESTFRPTGHRRAVATALADDGGRFPGDADSSTDAMPSITSPSPGISSPASTTTMSPCAAARPAPSSRSSRPARESYPTHLAKCRRLGPGRGPRATPRRNRQTNREPERHANAGGERCRCAVSGVVRPSRATRSSVVNTLPPRPRR